MIIKEVLLLSVVLIIKHVKYSGLVEIKTIDLLDTNQAVHQTKTSGELNVDEIYNQSLVRSKTKWINDLEFSWL